MYRSRPYRTAGEKELISLLVNWLIGKFVLLHLINKLVTW
jgi:hypothetical protein